MSASVQLGLRENAGLFSLLVLMSAFVGAMVGFERSLLPALTAEWSIGEYQASLLMVGVFGVSKALANLYTGKLVHQIGRKRTLLLGWSFALFSPLILLGSNDSAWILLANVALGFSQGLTWSTTVLMKIDIVGFQKRGTAMGLNESAGYLAVGLASAVSAWFFDSRGVVEPILYAALGVVVLAIFIALIAVPDTRPWVKLEQRLLPPVAPSEVQGVFWRTTYKQPTLRDITWAGVANNANDGVIWAVLPSALMASGVPTYQIGMLTGIHAAVWGVGQLFTGPLSNKGNLRSLVLWGMLLQSAGLLAIKWTPTLWLPYIAIGAGTALVYPTFLVGISNYSHPSWRPQAMAAYRFWRDMGYFFGALVGFIGVRLGQPWAVFFFIAAVTAFAGIKFQRFGKS